MRTGLTQVILYAETSAVLAWLFGEKSGDHVVFALNAADLVVSSVLTAVETERALLRALHVGRVKESESAEIRKLAAENFRSWEYLEITAAVRERATRPFPVEPVRSLDAIHLASMLQFVGLYGGIEVISFDQRVVENLAPLGLTAHGGAGTSV
jgi:uncharacterized protein with PIN domain